MTDAPAPHRAGAPDPLGFYLGAAAAAWAAALGARPQDQARLGPAAAAHLRAMLDGIEVWQRHPYRREAATPPVLWAEGSSRLLDHGVAGGQPVLVVPSLINRAYVLDLTRERSLLRGLAARGLRPLLLDWGAPGGAEAAFGLGDYLARRLVPALSVARDLAGAPVGVLGHCMGGTLAVALAARAPCGIGALVTLGAPWDFGRARGLAGALCALARGRGAAGPSALIAGLGQTFGLVPVAVFQALFALLDPLQAAVKFPRLARMDPASGEARRFVALEDWLADGVPMAAPAAHDLLVGWHLANDPARGAWRALGGIVEPGAVRAPALVVCGTSDRIAPPEVAEPLAGVLGTARLIRPPLGHVGMIVGATAEARVWEPVAAFLRGAAG